MNKKKDKITLRAKIRVLFRLLSFSGNYGWLLLLSLLLALVYAIAANRVPVIIGNAIDVISADGFVLSDLKEQMGLLPLFIAIAAVSSLLLNLSSVRSGTGIIKNVRRAAFNKIQKLPLAFLDSRERGDTLSRIVNDTDRLSDCLLTGLVSLYSSVLGIIVTLVTMFVISWPVALAVAVLTPLSMLLAAFISGRTYTLFKKSASLSSKKNGIIDEAVSRTEEIRIFGNAELCKKQFGKANDEYCRTATKAVFFSSLTNPTTRFVNSVVYCCVVLTGGLLTLSGKLRLGDYVILMTFAREYAKPFNDLSGVLAEVQNALASTVRVFELLDSKEEVPDAPDCHILTKEEQNGEISANKLDFSYTDKPFMKDLSFTAEKGMRVAIVGPTGCGKTTLINLFMRFFEPTSGSISIDGINIQDISRQSLRSSVGMVLQDTWISDGTVADNIRIGKPDASDEEVVEAAKKSFAHSFIMRLPDGYQTKLGDSGIMLSAGERQLLCICRVMLAAPPILILDEATSSIDTRTEIKIQKAFAELMKGRTSFIVAHRLNTIRNADKIIVMKDGCIIEQGTHKTLMSSHGFYADLYNASKA